MDQEYLLGGKARKAHLAPFAEAVDRLDEIPGVGATAAAVIIAEIGVDMSRFLPPAHLCSWARLSLGIKFSAGKPRGRGRQGMGIATWPASWVKPRSLLDGPRPPRRALRRIARRRGK